MPGTPALPPQWPHTRRVLPWAGRQPSGRRAAASRHAPHALLALGARQECFAQGRGKPGHGKRLFPSDSVLFACCNKAQVQGNSSGLQYEKCCSLCQGWCRQFQEMIPCLLPGEQNVLLRDFTAIKLMPVVNFKKPSPKCMNND